MGGRGSDWGAAGDPAGQARSALAVGARLPAAPPTPTPPCLPACLPPTLLWGFRYAKLNKPKWNPPVRRPAPALGAALRPCTCAAGDGLRPVRACPPPVPQVSTPPPSLALHAIINPPPPPPRRARLCPQNKLFGPAWAVFYASMGLASWVTARKGEPATMPAWGRTSARPDPAGWREQLASRGQLRVGISPHCTRALHPPALPLLLPLLQA